ncbi:MAG: HEAT repeat domain-containing protein [Anaerolineae bacterium]|nr:HEAT repeat domain-containing protein [Anaerolineae bacterium]
MEQREHIFISYSHEDEDFANELKENLSGQGYQPWVDKSRLEAGDNWLEAVDSAINRAFALILVLSPHSVSSQYVIYEFGYAVGVRLDVIPILHRPIDARDQHPRLAALHYLNFTSSERYPWPQLYTRLERSKSQRRSNLSAIQQIRPRLESLRLEECLDAVENLSQINDPAAYEAILDAAQHPMKDVRAHAMSKLIELTLPNDTRAMPMLQQALQDPYLPIRKGAIQILGKMGEIAAPSLAYLLHDPDPNINTLATTALLAIGPTVVPAVLRTVNIDNPDNTNRVMRMVMKLSDTSVPYLQEAIHDPNMGVRKVAADLMKAKGKRVTKEVMALLDDDTTAVRFFAAQILGGNDTPTAVQGLIRRLSDPIAVVRQAAADALGETADPAAVPALIATLSDSNPAVGEAVFNALLQIGSRAVPELVDALPNTDRDTRRDIANLLGQIGDPRAVPMLARTLWDKEPSVMQAALRAFQMIGEGAIPGLITLLQHKDEKLRIAAAWALGEIGNREAVPALIKTLEDRRSAALRQQAADALGRIGDAEAVNALSRALGDREKEVRKEAADALRKIGTPDSLKAYENWLRRGGR